MTRRSWLRRGLLLVLALALAWALVTYALREDPVAVVIAPVERGTVEETAANTRAGSVVARRRAKLSTGTSGIVVALCVERGDRVSAGAELLRLADATESALLLQAERSHAFAEARHERTCLAAMRAERVFRRDERLVAERGIVSEDQLDASRSAHELAAADCRVAAAEVAVAEAEVKRARAEFEKTRLFAPFDAVIGEVGVEVGEWVTPSVPLLAAPDLIDAIDLSSLYVEAPMDEVDANLFRVGQEARVMVDSHQGQSFPGRIARIAPFVLDVEQQNRTLAIEVELVDQAFSATLLPGTSADVEVRIERRDDVLRIPTFALLEGQRVLVLSQGELVSRDVDVGLGNWEWTEVKSGLSAGERVVTSLDRPGVEAGTRAVEDGAEEP
jgi:HlyD family secretion protein